MKKIAELNEIPKGGSKLVMVDDVPVAARIDIHVGILRRAVADARSDVRELRPRAAERRRQRAAQVPEKDTKHDDAVAGAHHAAAGRPSVPETKT